MATTPHRRALHQAQQSNPTTPKTYVTTSIDATHALTPPFSLSASVPFDWVAARGKLPPPYGPDPRLAPKKAPSTPSEASTTRKRVIRQESVLKRIKNYPSHLLFELSLIPQRLSLPEPRIFGLAAGVFCHALTVLTGYLAAPVKSEFDTFGDDWSDLRGEIAAGIPDPYADHDNGYSVAWLCFWLLLLGSIVNAGYVFSRFRIYHLNMRTEQNAVKSPNALFVKRSVVKPQETKESTMSTISHFLRIFGRQTLKAWRFVCGTIPKADESEDAKDMIQALAVWYPGDFELALLAVYSPMSAVLHTMLSRQYWLRWIIVQVSLAAILHLLISFYRQLVKDNQILAAEVMYEYNEGFVYPTINVVRKDACVMTNEAEIVDVPPARTPRQSMAATRDNLPQRAVVLGQGRTYQQLQQDRLQDSSPRIARPRHTVAGITTGGIFRP